MGKIADNNSNNVYTKHYLSTNNFLETFNVFCSTSGEKLGLTNLHKFGRKIKIVMYRSWRCPSMFTPWSVHHHPQRQIACGPCRSTKECNIFNKWGLETKTYSWQNAYTAFMQFGSMWLATLRGNRNFYVFPCIFYSTSWHCVFLGNMFDRGWMKCVAWPIFHEKRLCFVLTACSNKFTHKQAFN